MERPAPFSEKHMEPPLLFFCLLPVGRCGLAAPKLSPQAPKQARCPRTHFKKPPLQLPYNQQQAFRDAFAARAAF
jgi:hypothetical protein